MQEYQSVGVPYFLVNNRFTYNWASLWKFLFPLHVYFDSLLSFTKGCRVGVAEWFTVPCGMDSHGLESRTSINVCRHVCRYVDQKGLAAMLTSIQLAGVTPEVNLRNLLCTGKEAHKRGNPPWPWNPGQTSPEVQNRGISGPTKRTYVLQKLKTRSFIQGR